VLFAIAGLLTAVVVAVFVLHRGFIRFRRRVRVYLEHSGDIAWRQDTRLGAIWAVLGYDLDVDLLATYVYHLRRRGDESVLLADLAAALRARVPAVAMPPFPLVRDRILPLLKQTYSLPPIDGYVRENRILRRRLDDGISIVYAIEGQHRITLVTDGMPTAWEIDVEELHDLAVQNLRARTRHLLDEIGGPSAAYVDLDGFDAARLLVADLIVPAAITHPVFAIPHEHACLIAEATARGALAAEAEALFRISRSPLTTRLYRLGSPGDLPVADDFAADIAAT
jgi:hypothetical protein